MKQMKIDKYRVTYFCVLYWLFRKQWQTDMGRWEIQIYIYIFIYTISDLCCRILLAYLMQDIVRISSLPCALRACKYISIAKESGEYLWYPAAHAKGPPRMGVCSKKNHIFI